MEAVGTIKAPSGRRFEIYSEEERAILSSLGWTDFEEVSI